MKRILITLAFVLGLGVLSSFAWVGITHAADIRGGTAPTVGKNEVVDGSVYMAGRNVTIDGTVKGDVFCAGANVVVTGKVEGDIICAGQIVHITGTVLGDVRLAGQQVDLGAAVSGSATVAAQSFELLPDAKITRDLTVGGQAVRLEGEVSRDILGAVRQLMVNGTVGRNVQVRVENLELEQKAKIGGNLTYSSPEQLQKEDGASIAGTTDYKPAPKSQRYTGQEITLWATLYGFGSLLVIGLAAIAIAPRWFDALAGAVRTRPLGSFGYGAAVLFGTPIAAILLLFTVVGAPLGLIVALMWIVAMIASMVVTSYAVGWVTVEKLAWPSRGRRLASLVIGLLIIALLGMIPVIGGIVRLGALVFGLGAIAVVLMNRLRPRAAKAKKAQA